MDISERGIEFIKSWEGFSPTVYKDVGGLGTIGYGHLIRPGEQFTTLSKDQGDTLLRSDVAAVVRALNSSAPGVLRQNEFDALCSLAYNIGPNALLGSTLFRELALANKPAAAEEIKKWCHVKGQVVKGLLARRLAEQSLFLEGS